MSPFIFLSSILKSRSWRFFPFSFPHLFLALSLTFPPLSHTHTFHLILIFYISPFNTPLSLHFHPLTSASVHGISSSGLSRAPGPLPCPCECPSARWGLIPFTLSLTLPLLLSNLHLPSLSFSLSFPSYFSYESLSLKLVFNSLHYYLRYAAGYRVVPLLGEDNIHIPLANVFIHITVTTTQNWGRTEGWEEGDCNKKESFSNSIFKQKLFLVY